MGGRTPAGGAPHEDRGSNMKHANAQMAAEPDGPDPVKNRICPPGPGSPIIDRPWDVSPIDAIVPWDSKRYLLEKAADDAAAAVANKKKP